MPQYTVTFHTTIVDEYAIEAANATEAIQIAEELVESGEGSTTQYQLSDTAVVNVELEEE